jgi:hypothetical protein
MNMKVHFCKSAERRAPSRPVGKSNFPFPRRFLPFILVVVSSLVLASCSKPDSDDKAAGAVEKPEANAKPGVTLDAETQARLGLQTETPLPAQWRPVMQATGRVADPMAFLAAATDYETARRTAAASQAELERTQKLAAQENASPRMLEAAQVAAARDALAVQAAQAKFAADWGRQLASNTNLAALAEQLQSGDLSYARLFLPVGSFPDPLPETATLDIFSDETNTFAAELVDNLNIDPATQTQTLLFSVKQKLTPGLAVGARLAISGEPVIGVLVPASAIVRHQGTGWVYVQTETNQFVRAEVPLDRSMAGGWFVSENLSATNRIVVTGAAAVLSAELSGSGFNTGQRD